MKVTCRDRTHGSRDIRVIQRTQVDVSCNADAVSSCLAAMTSTAALLSDAMHLPFQHGLN